MNNKNNILIGYDIGTKTVKVVYGTNVTDHTSIKLEHFSDPQGIIRKIEKKINGSNQHLKGYVTGRYQDSIRWRDAAINTIDWTKPAIKYCNDFYGNNIRYIINIGAAGLSLLELKEGRFHRFVTNSICASGTGSFLDQQMLRMGLDFDTVDKMTISERVPSIASRCAVFAKSDLIHRQQEGYTVEELWNGLVKGMAEACFITLLRGNNITGKVLFIGGLVKNKLFLHYFSQLLEKDTLVIPKEPDTFLALTCLHYAEQNVEDGSFTAKVSNQPDNSRNNKALERPLNPGKSQKHKYHRDPFNNEITVYDYLQEAINKTEKPAIHTCKAENNSDENDNKRTTKTTDNKDNDIEVPAVLGVDIGSTSTKAALIHFGTGKILLGLYRKTQGNPIRAYQKILKGINRFTKDNNCLFRIKGMGTTGSGRKIVGAFAGADQCINEITAHLKGGLREVPGVRTIFEIGGQDSKYIFVEDGWMKDANMNYVCAAGTGSFLEEQAQNLNFKLDEFEDLCRGAPAPKTNDRCTVFMEQDSKKLLVDGHSKSEIVASLLYSVCRNYLHRVVQNRAIEEPILFLGATARNKGLVEAFSNILNKKIVTSPNSHLTGAIGVAELVRNDFKKHCDSKIKADSLQAAKVVGNNNDLYKMLTDVTQTSFKGFSLHSNVIEFKEKNCSDCHNNCRIMYFESEAGTVSWGYQCGKEGLDKSAANKAHKQPAKKDYFHFVRNFNEKLNKSPIPGKHSDVSKTIYIPKALFYHSHNFLWQKFWLKLGFNVLTLSDTNADILSTALGYSPNEICFPLKVAIGHIIYALKNKYLPVFVPYLIRDSQNKAASNSYFCPMTQSLPAIIKSILQYNGLSEEGVYSPVIDLSISNVENIEALYNYFQDKLKLTKKDIASAFVTALEEYKALQSTIYDTGTTALSHVCRTYDQNLSQTADEPKMEKAIKEVISSVNNKQDSCSSPVLVIIGRAYNLYDNSLNLGLVKDAKGYGYTLLPSDLIPIDRENIDKNYHNMYWTYGQKVIAIAKEILKYPNTYPVFLTNFNCGPDSFILSMVEDIWQDKPYLILELDEHSGNAGYLTRIEAFLDRIKRRDYVCVPKQSLGTRGEGQKDNQLPPKVKPQAKRNIHNTRPAQPDKPSAKVVPAQSKHKSQSRLLIPPMNPVGTKLAGSAFRGYGYNAVPLLKEDLNTFHLGKSHLRGSECLPAASTLGSILDYCNQNNIYKPGCSPKDSCSSSTEEDTQTTEKTNERTAVFMPCASGPCRFGQYAFLHKMILDRLNINADILSVNSENNYGGFSPGLRLQLFKSLILTDILNKLGNKLRPYEKEKGQVDKLLNKYLDQLAAALAEKDNITAQLKLLRKDIDKLGIKLYNNKPLVGIVGEIYVRSSPFSNDSLINKIERNNAEGWLTPFMEWLHYTSYLKKQKKPSLLAKTKENVADLVVHHYETKYYNIFDEILSNRIEPVVDTLIEKAVPYIPEAIRGEAVLTVGRALCFIEQGASMIVNVSPFGCMPGTISSIILKNIAQKYSIPIVSLYYDGYKGFDTQLEHYLHNLNGS